MKGERWPVAPPTTIRASSSEERGRRQTDIDSFHGQRHCLAPTRRKLHRACWRPPADFDLFSIPKIRGHSLTHPASPIGFLEYFGSRAAFLLVTAYLLNQLRLWIRRRLSDPRR